MAATVLDAKVNPDDGSVGDYLSRMSWYDDRGQVVKTATANGLFQKYAYDGLGRIVASSTSYDTDETAYAEADDVSGDTVIQQGQTWYDQAGQAIATATYERLPDDTSTSGALSAANSYATAMVLWYDGLGRTVATAEFGRAVTIRDSRITSLMAQDVRVVAAYLSWRNESPPPTGCRVHTRLASL